MSTEPVTDPEVDVDPIAHLDFDPDVDPARPLPQCQLRYMAMVLIFGRVASRQVLPQRCPLPAQYVVLTGLCHCGKTAPGPALVCERHWREAGSAGVCCPGCGCVHPRDEFWRLLSTLGGGS